MVRLADIVLPGDVPSEERPSVNHGGERAETRAIVIHATRGPSIYAAATAPTSGAAWFAEVRRQYAIAVDYMEKPNPSSVGPTVCIGPDRVARMVPDDLINYTQTVDNPYCIGVEIAQDKWQSPFHSNQVKYAATLAALWCEKYGLPIVYLGRQTTSVIKVRGILGHEDLYSGWSRGKTDPGYRWNWPGFISLVKSEHARLFDRPNPILSRTGAGLTAYYNIHKARFGAPVDQWWDDGGEVLVTSSTRAHPTGQWHIARKALDWEPITICWCHKPGF